MTGPHHEADLVHRASYPVLGRMLEVRTNDRRILALAESAFGHWRALAPGLIEERQAARIDIRVSGDDVRPDDASAFGVYRHSWTGDQFRTRAEDVEADSDLAVGIGAVRIGARAIQDGEGLIHHILDAHALQLLTRAGREPLHAAAVSRGGSAILIAGPSEEGKSTLCYALLRRGWRLIADDATFLDLGAGRVWGHAAAVRLLPDSDQIFPELAGIPARRLPNGKVKREVRVEAPALTGAPIGLVVLGGPRDAVPRLEPIPAREAIAFMFANVSPGFDRYPGAKLAVEDMARAWATVRFTPSPDPAASAARIEAWAAGLGVRA
ncbi:MAG: hypothetical protein ABIQ99_09925 [Thermoflexales bacterium]